MKYALLLWPHANVRYQNETLKLAECEFQLMLNVHAPEGRIAHLSALDLPGLEIELPGAMDDALLRAVKSHSLMYALFEIRPDGAYLPVAGRAGALLGADLPGILKYKGKTNELFLQLLINVALYASGFVHRSEGALELIDPMCGRATSLFVAANRGWNATGTDVDRAGLSEAEKFLKRYFEYHRMKHSYSRQSRTTPGGKGVQVSQFGFAADAEAYRAGDLRTLRLACADAGRAREIFGKEKFHLLVCDLPYGVQHASTDGGAEKLLARALPAWREALKKGGVAALSFNAQTLPRRRVQEIMESAGLEVCRGGAFDGFAHWVEQAVTRDIAVGRRKN